MPAPARISRDSDSERLTKVASRKHSIHTHFPKDRNCEICQRRPKLRGPRAEDAMAEPYFVQKFLVTVNLETITDMQSWCRTWPFNGSSRIRAKQKLHRRRKRVYESFLSRHISRKSFTLTMHWNFGKSCEDLSCNHRTSTPHRSETNGIA